MRTSAFAILALVLTSSVGLAETFPVPTPDPHAASWGEKGSFTLHYYGTLDDGTACPASPNMLKFGIEDESGVLRYLHGFGVDPEIAEDLRVPFQVGQFCTLAFDGEVRFLMHHGTQARIRPSAVSPPEEIEP